MLVGSHQQEFQPVDNMAPVLGGYFSLSDTQKSIGGDSGGVAKGALILINRKSMPM
jgi:hypothetical protein